MELSSEITKNVAAAFAEDVGSGDLTAKLIPENQSAAATVLSREAAVLCGTRWFDASFRYMDKNVVITWYCQDGQQVSANQTLCTVRGNARAMLTAERSALNFLQLLSATATNTRRYVDAIRGTKAVIMDTRKTLPGLRYAQKYAVMMGGGKNQRIGLFDGILVKENHIAAAGGIQPALQQARHIAGTNISVQIEVETLQQLSEALANAATSVLLDNFSLQDLSAAVKLTQGRAQLEASGGITLDNVRDIAQTGVDRISIGSLTKDIKAVDLSMRFSELL